MKGYGGKKSKGGEARGAGDVAKTGFLLFG